MATVTLSMTALTDARRPRVSSPLAASSLGNAGSAIPPQRGAAFHPKPSQRPQPPPRTASFPTSRPIRPFASISHVTAAAKGKNGKPVKLIEPPANHRAQFVLDLTQAELRRQD